jgi:cell division protein FtsB
MKKMLFALVICIALASIINSFHSIYVLLQKRDLLIAAQTSLEQEKKENQKLKNQLKNVSSKSFVEEESRNKLFFVKPGESTIFIAKELVTSPSAEKQVHVEETNWQQWMKLFL